jgi:hypothetical protein
MRNTLIGTNPTGVRHRGPLFNVQPLQQHQAGEGDGGQGSGTQEDQQGSAAAQGEGSTKYSPPASQDDLDRIIGDRVARERAKYADYDALKEKAGKHDALERELATDKDKAVLEAREATRKEALAEATPKIVRAEFRAAAKGVLTKDQLDGLLEDYNPSNYLTDTGEVDEDKIAARVAKFAPKQTTTTTARDMGQGNRQQSTVSAREQGRAEAEKRYGKKP